MKKALAVLMAVVLFAASILPVSAAGLDIPTIEYNGKTYYDLSGKEDYIKAARYGIDNRLSTVPVKVAYSKFPDFQSNNIWYCNVNNFDYTGDSMYFTYAQYAPSTVCMTGYFHDFENGIEYGDIDITYIDSNEELEKGDAMLDAELAKIASYTKADKIRYIAEYICKHVDAGFKEMPGGGYDTINGVYDLMTGVRTNVVCSSFTFLFQRFMERAGYKSYIATNENHAWNVVELEGKWYGVDCTFADQGTQMDEGYFLMGMDRLKQYVLLAPEDVFAELEKEQGCQFAETAYGAEPAPTETTAATTAPTVPVVTAPPATTAATAAPTTPVVTTPPATTAATIAPTVPAQTTPPATTAATAAPTVPVVTAPPATTAATTAPTTPAATDPTETIAVTEATVVPTTPSVPAGTDTATDPTSAVTIDVSQQVEVMAEVFETAVQNGEDVVLQAETYQWSFAADKLTDVSMDAPLNTTIQVGDAVAQEDIDILEEINKEEEFFPFSFAHHGALPGEAEISIRVDTSFAEKAVDIYSIDADGKAVLEGSGTVSADAELVFSTNHCSLWFIKEAQPEQAPSAGGWIIVLCVAVIVIAAGAVGAWLVLRKKRAV